MTNVGGYKVTWRSGYIGNTTRVYIGLNDDTAITSGTYSLIDAIRRVIAQSENVNVERVCLLEVKAGRKIIVKETFDNTKHGYKIAKY